jgi:hypothetical protein
MTSIDLLKFMLPDFLIENFENSFYQFWRKGSGKKVGRSFAKWIFCKTFEYDFYRPFKIASWFFNREQIISAEFWKPARYFE